MDWVGNPITTEGDGYILPRKAEMIFNSKYYPNSKVGEWPCDPISGEKLSIDPRLRESVGRGKKKFTTLKLIKHFPKSLKQSLYKYQHIN